MITLNTLKDATAQEVFDQVAEHLLTQNRTSFDGQSCKYRIVLENKDILKCAAGCLIGDDEYNPDFEGRTWKRLVSLGLVPLAHAELIKDLQKVHDLINFTNWNTTLKCVATRHHLNFKW